MEEKIISKNEIGTFLDRLKENNQLIAPVLKGGEVVFDRIDSVDEVVLEFSNAKKVPKSVFFPKEEVIILQN